MTRDRLATVVPQSFPVEVRSSMEVHKVLCLPRTLPMEVQEVSSGERGRERERERCQETSSFTIVHLLHRSVHVQLHGAIQCTLDRGLEPKDSCQRKTIQRRAQTNDKQTAAEFYMVAEQGSW